SESGQTGMRRRRYDGNLPEPLGRCIRRRKGCAWKSYACQKKELWDRCARQKTSVKRATLRLWVRLRSTTGNPAKIRASVTTSHVFPPNQRRNVSLLLRFWLPISLWPPVNVTRQRPRGAGVK